MKRTVFCRLISVCPLLLLCMQAMPVMAAGDQTITLEFRTLENADYAFQASAVDFSKSHLYYDQLNDPNQRLVYDTIAGLTPGNHSVQIELTELPDFTFPPEGITTEFVDSLNAYIMDVVLPAYSAAYLDIPDLFWTSRVSYGGNVDHNGERITVIYLLIEVTPLSHFDAATYSETVAALENKINTLSFDESQGTYGLLKQFHDYLCEATVYTEAPNAHNIVGPLLDGESVCEGYARTFKLFCNMYDIPCMVVIGMGASTNGPEAHAWNVVRMEDGKWYGVDVTWDDQISGIYYDFFMVGGDTLPEYFEEFTFDQSHQAQNDLFGTGNAVMVAPVLNSTAYVPVLPHEHEYTAVVTEPTCTEDGYTTYTCACGHSYVGDETDPLGHDYAESVTEPTCTEAGYTTYTCACGDSYVDDETDPLGHDFGDWVLTEPGVETRTCSRCDETETREATPVYDQDGDGEVTESDAKMLMDLLVSGTTEDQQCDMDFDGKFTIYDCILILQQIG